MKTKSTLFVAILSIFFVTALIISGCVPKPPVPPKFVTYLSLHDVTGPVAPADLAMAMGVEDYFKTVNAKGGVDGVTLRFLSMDTRYCVARAVSGYMRFRGEPKLVAVWFGGTPLGKAAGPLTEADGVVSFTPADGEWQHLLGRMFLAGPAYQDMFAAVVDWVIADWKAKGKPGIPALGLMAWDNPYGREHIRGGKEYAEMKRPGEIKILTPEYFPVGTLDHKPFLARLDAAGANYIYIGSLDPTPAIVLKDAMGMGLIPKIQFLNDTWGLFEHSGVKLAPKAVEGAITVSFYLREDSARNHPLVKETWERWRGTPVEEMWGAYAVGINRARQFEEVIRRALKEVGFEKLGPDDVFRHYKGLTGFDQKGLLFSPCTYAEKDRRPSNAVKIYLIRGGKVIPHPGMVDPIVKTPDGVALYKWK